MGAPLDLVTNHVPKLAAPSSHLAWPCGCTDQTLGLGGAGAVWAQPGSPSSCRLECLPLGSSPGTAVLWGAAPLDCGRQLGSQAAARTTPGVRARRLDAPATSGARASRTPLSPSAPRTRELELSRRHKPLGFAGHVRFTDWASCSGRGRLSAITAPRLCLAAVHPSHPDCGGSPHPHGRGRLCAWRLRSARTWGLLFHDAACPPGLVSGW